MVELSEFLLGQISVYCESVKNGCKPAAMVPVQEKYGTAAIEFIESQGLKIYTENVDKTWKTIFIYKDEYILDVIKSVPKYPNSIFEHWALGKLFGYSDQEIKDFVMKL